MVKGTQDGETFQQKKIQEIFSAEKIMCENCQSHNGSWIMNNETHPQTLGMDVAPKMEGGNYHLTSMYML